MQKMINMLRMYEEPALLIPLRVVRCALENASSTSTNAIIYRLHAQSWMIQASDPQIIQMN